MTITLVQRQEIARDTWEFLFTKPADVTARAGQYINLKLPDLLFPDRKGPRRTFTLASAPHEEHWRIATRLTGSGFKQTLLEMPLGSSCEYIGPRGELILRAEAPSFVFIAGGIGITPFRSMTLAWRQQPDKPLTLFHANADVAGMPYRSLFSGLGEAKFTFVPTITGENEHDWNGETRPLSLALFQDYVADFSQPLFYLVGPPAMVTDLTAVLQNKGVAGDRILSESFFGYA
jgi:ferredoxin-NADP reductase